MSREWIFASGTGRKGVVDLKVWRIAGLLELFYRALGFGEGYGPSV